MTFFRKKLGSSLSLLLLSWMFFQCSGGDETPTAQASVQPVETTTVKKVVPVESYNTLIAKTSQVTQPIEVTGRVIPMQSINVQAEVQGTLLPNKKAFKEGVVFKKGETLIQIDNTQLWENLKAQHSQLMSTLVVLMSDIENDYPDAYEEWNAYLEHFQNDQLLPPLPEVMDSRLKYFLSARNVFNIYHNIKSAETSLPKYQISAPFTGVVMSSSVDPGALVTPQIRLGTFNQIGTYEVEASVATQAIDRVKVGQVLELKEVGTSKTWKATVQRIGKRVDPATQTVKIFLRVSGASLRENLYVEGEIEGETFDNVFLLPREIVSAQNQVYIIKNGVAKLKDIQVKGYKGNSVLVDGLAEGDVVINEILSSPIEGTKVVARE